MRPYADIAKQYAERVLSGEILACEYVRLACARHLKDLDRQGDASFPYRFDEDAALRPCAFAELMPHVKGKWASRGELIHLEDWQVFITAVVYGWIRKADGLRRFRVSYIEVPRKNGKSAWSAALGLYMLSADGEAGAEVYSGATSEKQALEVFKPALMMAKKRPDMCGSLGIEPMASNVNIPANGSKFEPVIGKPGDGASPSMAIIDEYHEHQTDDLVDTMRTGMGAREQPLLWIITTAGSDIAGPCYAMHSDVIRVLDGTMEDDELFGIIYTIDKDDKWDTDEALRKANPNYSVSVDPGFLRSQIKEAREKSRKTNTIKTKHLNVWTSAREAFFNMEDFNLAGDPTLTEEDFLGEPCWMAVDIASTQDIVATSKLFQRGDDWYLFVRSYLPESRTQDPEAQHYQGWVKEGHLIATEGDVTDLTRIQEDIEADAQRFRILSFGYDPFNAVQMALSLQKLNVNVVEVRQNVMQLSEPMKDLEKLIISGKLKHDGNPCTAWQFGNVTAKEDANGNVYPRKDRREFKIDAAVATIIAKRVSMIEVPDTSSVYETRGIRTL